MNKILIGWLIGLVFAGLVFMALMPFCNVHGSEYETYADQKYLVYHEGELGQIYIDTMTVISKTERGSEIYLRGLNGNVRIIKPPDYIIKLEN